MSAVLNEGWMGSPLARLFGNQLAQSAKGLSQNLLNGHDRSSLILAAFYGLDWRLPSDRNLMIWLLFHTGRPPAAPDV
jgi:hypothetical protein